MNFELARRYFKVIDETINYKASAIAIGIGVAFLLLFRSSALMVIIALAAIALGVYMIVGKMNNIKKEKASVPTDLEYDNEVAKQLNGLQARALNKLGLDEDEVKEIDPISFDGYVYKGANNYKVGADNLYRTNKYEAVMLLFSQNEVHCYTYRFDTTEDKKTEETDVYFYKDIVSVSTASDEVKFGGKSFNYEYFKLTTAGGTALTVSLRDVNNAQRSINAMRSLLREKKQG